jgi:aldehyde dehydrogenase (NAD+)
MSILPDTQLCIAGDLPFGGYKSSGIGRAWGIEGIEEYFEKKALAWRVPGTHLGI